MLVKGSACDAAQKQIGILAGHSPHDITPQRGIRYHTALDQRASATWWSYGPSMSLAQTAASTFHCTSAA